MSELLAQAEPLILSPDRYYWPGDEFEGVKHINDHMVLLIGLRGGTLELLDTDAPPECDYRRTLGVTNEVIESCTRFGTVEDKCPSNVDCEDRTRELLQLSIESLDRDIPPLLSFSRKWAANGLSIAVARGLHIAVLGDFQPQLFLLARLLEGTTVPDMGDVGTAADDSAAHAMRLGMLLLAEHRLGRSNYLSCHESSGALISSLIMLRKSGQCALKVPPNHLGETDGAHDVEERISAISSWCLGEMAPMCGLDNFGRVGRSDQVND